MKPIIKKYNLFLLVLQLGVFPLACLSQTRPLQEVKRVVVTVQHQIESGNILDKNWTISQEIYDSLDRLHTIVYWENKKPVKQQWHSFKGNLITKTEIIENNTFTSYVLYSYNSDNLLENKTIRKINTNDTVTYLKIKYYFDEKKLPIKVVASDKNGRTAYTSKSKFDSFGTELNRKVKTKRGYLPSDSILLIKSSPIYDSLGRLTKNTLTIKKLNDTYTNILNYKYDKKSNPVEIVISDLNGRQINKETRLYHEVHEKRIMWVKQYDSENNLLLFLKKRYEIYPSKNRREREIEY